MDPESIRLRCPRSGGHKNQKRTSLACRTSRTNWDRRARRQSDSRPYNVNDLHDVTRPRRSRWSDMSRLSRQLFPFVAPSAMSAFRFPWHAAPLWDHYQIPREHSPKHYRGDERYSHCTRTREAKDSGEILTLRTIGDTAGRYYRYWTARGLRVGTTRRAP
jgi:hypothetical protein